MKLIEPYTIGMGDRFGHQGRAQLEAVCQANAVGIPVFPVWNKSHREHSIIGSTPESLRAEADAAVYALEWSDSYYVDADHIRLETVDGFLHSSDFFTLDVADFIGQPAEPAEVDAWLSHIRPFFGNQIIDGMDTPLSLDEDSARTVAAKFLRGINQASALYQKIKMSKIGDFVVEVSIDETDEPQTPTELCYILSMIAAAGIPVQTIAPKFTGRFNKGVDYVGTLNVFEQEFHADLCIIRFAILTFGLPESLKISVHSGSDKFSLYPIINRLIQQHRAGLHVKTAGTTWLEEVIGLARSDGEALALAKDIYAGSLAAFDELTAPYRTVIDIDPAKLPAPQAVASWTAEQFVNALEHKPNHPDYNPHLRQLIHVGYKVAAKYGTRYTEALRAHASTIGNGVTHNLLQRHIRPIFGLNNLKNIQ